MIIWRNGYYFPILLIRLVFVMDKQYTFYALGNKFNYYYTDFSFQTLKLKICSQRLMNEWVLAVCIYTQMTPYVLNGSPGECWICKLFQNDIKYGPTNFVMTKVLWLSLIQVFRYKCRFRSHMKLIELSYFHSYEQKDNPYFSCKRLLLKHRRCHTASCYSGFANGKS